MIYNKAFYKNAGGLSRPLTKQELLNEIKIRLDRGQTNLNDIDTSKITDMSSLFYEISQNVDVSLWDTSNVTNMKAMFSGCYALTTVPLIDTSSVTNMYDIFYSCSSLTTIPALNTINVKNMNYMLGGCTSLASIPEFDASSVTDMSSYFGFSTMNNLRDVGGWKNLKCNWNDSNGLSKCPNLTHQSCINILNGLYDFTGNGETPNYNQGKLKVHANFLTTVGEDISIGINKGWTITS